jgi:predicted nucleic acid-binding protein
MRNTVVRAYIDANVLIRMMERTDAAADASARLFSIAERGKLKLVTSELSLSEVLVGPIANADLLLEKAYLDLLTDEPLIELVPLSRAMLIEAARIRAVDGAARRLPASGVRRAFRLSPHPLLRSSLARALEDRGERAFGPPLRRARHPEAMSDKT